MKNFLKDILIFLVLMIFVSVLFQSVGNQKSDTSESQTQDRIDLIEDQISQGNVVGDGDDEEMPVEIRQNNNLLSRIFNSLADFFTKAINFFISLIMTIVSAFLG